MATKLVDGLFIGNRQVAGRMNIRAHTRARRRMYVYFSKANQQNILFLFEKINHASGYRPASLPDLSPQSTKAAATKLSG